MALQIYFAYNLTNHDFLGEVPLHEVQSRFSLSAVQVVSLVTGGVQRTYYDFETYIHKPRLTKVRLIPKKSRAGTTIRNAVEKYAPHNVVTKI